MELFQTIAEAIAAYGYIFWPLFGLMVLTLVVIRWWNTVSYFFLNLAASFPLIGHIARLSRSHEPRRPGTGNKEWYPSEEALCAKYYAYHQTTSRDASFYRRCVDYLDKVEERGRKPTGIVLWLCSIALVILEAFIFALVLSPFIANNISANQAEFSALVISVLIGVILVPATHLMGAELHKNTLLKKIRYWHSEARHNKSAKELMSSHRITLENSRDDDGEPNYIQILNRINHGVQVKPQYWCTFVALVLITTFAFGAYFIRAATINAMETQAVNASPFSQSGAESGGSPFELPAAAVEDNHAADKQAVAEVASNRVFASKLTFIILSVIFVGVQLIGILIGIFRSFAGIDSAKAAKYIGNFSGSDEFAAYHAARRERVERDAQQKLATLQNRLMMQRQNGRSEPLSQMPTFDDYVLGKQSDREKNQRHQNHEQAPTKTPQAAQVVASPAPETVSSVASATPDVSPAAPVAADRDDTARIESLGDLTTLSAEELAQVAKALGLSLDALASRQRVQAILNKARA
ncbi:hypothetical protein ACLECX_09495 [Lonsdalea quercina]|uniref:hypothetical protein n=1 Tax=Lonsdalea quercina TaxID=71657 RepID=UPI0039748765